MEEMSDDECSVAFSLKPIQFGTAGYRAKIGPGNHYLNEKTYKQLAIGYAKFLKNKFPNKNLKVLVTHDNRYNGMFYTDVVGSTLYENGITPIIVKNNELLPTPIASYLISKMELDGGINITASHNPKEYNGLKISFDNFGNACGKMIQDFRVFVENTTKHLIDSNTIIENIGILEKKEIKDEYLNLVKNSIKLGKRKIKAVVDTANGTASIIAKEMYNMFLFHIFSRHFPKHQLCFLQLVLPLPFFYHYSRINMGLQNHIFYGILHLYILL